MYFFNEGGKKKCHARGIPYDCRASLHYSCWKVKKAIRSAQNLSSEPILFHIPQAFDFYHSTGCVIAKLFHSSRISGGLNVSHVPYEVFKSYLNTTTNVTFIYCLGEKMVQPDFWGQEEGKWMLCGETWFFISLGGRWEWMAVNWLLKAAKKNIDMLVFLYWEPDLKSY